ncbi:hypothetical protein DF182_00590 [Chitinophaga flava]|uniref:Uncharacterized protein n=1 Tax=Chitinophaga flava TaxID=2259036 RepID=A0A365XZR4_9BACT|nr:hypothetical protein DF182_00590 [Chitinophaga flava]
MVERAYRRLREMLFLEKKHARYFLQDTCWKRRFAGWSIFCISASGARQRKAGLIQKLWRNSEKRNFN